MKAPTQITIIKNGSHPYGPSKSQCTSQYTSQSIQPTRPTHTVPPSTIRGPQCSPPLQALLSNYHALCLSYTTQKCKAKAALRFSSFLEKARDSLASLAMLILIVRFCRST